MTNSCWTLYAWYLSCFPIADNEQLATIPQDLVHYGGRLADYVEKHANSMAGELRDVMEQATWIPESFKPIRSHTNQFFARPPPPPQTLWQRSVASVSKNRTAIAIVVAFTGTMVYLVHRKKKEHARKRRAKKLPNGAKREVVLLACSTLHDPLTKSLAVDLERRGYVVYVTVSSTEEDSLVQQEAKADLRPLWIDLTSTVPNPSTDTHPNLEPIRDLLTKTADSSLPYSSSKRQSGSALSNMTLAGIIVFPGCTGYPVGDLSQLHPSDLVDSINTRLISPILTLQQFLPLLQRHSTDPASPSTIVLAYPSIPSSLSSPMRLSESLAASSLSALSASLRRELLASDAHVTVTELKLGNFDLTSVSPKSHPSVHTRDRYSDQSSSLLSTSSSQLTILQTAWHSSHHALPSRSDFSRLSLIKGSSAREFHNAVFDALAPPQVFKPFGKFEYRTSKKNESKFVGQGARTYDLVGRWVPDGLVGFMMGYRSRQGDTGRESLAGSVAFNASTAEENRSNDGRSLPSWGGDSHVGESAVWERV